MKRFEKQLLRVLLYLISGVFGLVGMILLPLQLERRIDSPEELSFAINSACYFAIPLAISAFFLTFATAYKMRMSRRTLLALTTSIIVWFFGWQITIFAIHTQERDFPTSLKGIHAAH